MEPALFALLWYGAGAFCIHVLPAHVARNRAEFDFAFFMVTAFFANFYEMIRDSIWLQ